MPPKEVFLSHSDKNRDFATKIANKLRRHGIPVWYSRTHIVGAQEWHDEIGAALKRCNWFVIVLSPQAVSSTWVKNELLFALNHHRYRKRIVPLLYKTCKYERLSWILPSFQIIDFRKSVESGFRELLRVWGIPNKQKKTRRKARSNK
jgi:hypothetical protein